MSRALTIATPALLAALALPASAGVVDTVVDTTAAGAFVNGSVAVGEYVGTVSGGGSGFGGPIGGGTVSVDSNANGVFFGFSGLGDFSGNAIRVYIDSVPGGISDLSSAGGFNDFGDFNRERFSRIAANGVTLPFDADSGFILASAFGGLGTGYQLTPGGNGSLTPYSVGATFSAVGEFPTLPEMEVFIPHADLGTTPGDTIDFVVTYANQNDASSAFLSDESFPFQFAGGNPGDGSAGPIIFEDFHRLVTTEQPIPEPASIALLAAGGLMIARRRRA